MRVVDREVDLTPAWWSMFKATKDSLPWCLCCEDNGGVCRCLVENRDDFPVDQRFREWGKAGWLESVGVFEQCIALVWCFV